MSKPQNKQDAPMTGSKSKLWQTLIQKSSVKMPTDLESQTRRKTLSKLSMIGSNGAGIFHKRGDRLKIPRYQNTYRLEPFRAFHAVTVDKIVRDVMEIKLSAITSYQPDQTSKLCLEIASDVLKAVCKKDYDRYKIVTQVYIIQRFQQSMQTAFQCLWDVERDNYSYHVFENSHIYAWCCVFGLYYD
ncbi:PREDICTED: tctex1 domain-containing protein 2-like isoform X1 [Trachymyrmex septentrionalis]|uniref:tctex1 domain-containing protein 2-like isoform X1 n=1 Tax=Trachymyrmex septentrionalis TaxID=34720 RepID=UPI00084EE38D|nr:PREDICTED: tctex1 domain-containing protein 2-like isoform X1 [Trachymyrmex septentrionalis]